MLLLLRRSFDAWRADRASQLGAATAYYTVFSLAPFLIMLIALAGLLLNEEQVRTEIFTQIRSLVGPNGASFIEGMINASAASDDSILAAILGLSALVLGASALMVGLQAAMNQIWKVETHPDKSAILVIALKRLFSIAMVFTMGFLFLVSLAVSAGVSYIVNTVSTIAPDIQIALPLINTLLSFSFIAILFAFLYKYVPDVSVPWKAIWPGALTSALLFTIGKSALGAYLGQRDFTATYGIAGSAVLLLLWINYSSQILYFGAELSREYALMNKLEITPTRYARFKVDKRVLARKPSFMQKTKVAADVVEFEVKTGWKLWRFFKRNKKD